MGRSITLIVLGAVVICRDLVRSSAISETDVDILDPLVRRLLLPKVYAIGHAASILHNITLRYPSSWVMLDYLKQYSATWHQSRPLSLLFTASILHQHWATLVREFCY